MAMKSAIFVLFCSKLSGMSSNCELDGANVGNLTRETEDRGNWRWDKSGFLGRRSSPSSKVASLGHKSCLKVGQLSNESMTVGRNRTLQLLAS